MLATLPIGAEWPASGPITRFFAIHHIRNTGMAFGLGQGRSMVFLAVALVVAVLLVAWAAAAPKRDRLLRTTLGLLVGGALGNAIDRVRFGNVVDFVDVRFFPIFNVADSAITIGVVLLAWHGWRAERERSAGDALAAGG